MSTIKSITVRGALEPICGSCDQPRSLVAVVLVDPILADAADRCHVNLCRECVDAMRTALLSAERVQS